MNDIQTVIYYFDLQAFPLLCSHILQFFHPKKFLMKSVLALLQRPVLVDYYFVLKLCFQFILIFVLVINITKLRDLICKEFYSSEKLQVS